MLTVEERIQEFGKKMEQIEHLEHQNLLKINRGKKEQEKLDRQRKYILGEIVLEYFPNLMALNPSTTLEENRLEFAGFRELMASLAEAINQSNKLDDELSFKNLTQ